MDSFGSAFCTHSRSSGTKAGQCLRTGINMSRAGTSGRKMRPGLGRPARTRRSGIPRARNSSWADQTRRNSTIRRKKPIDLMRRPILNHTKRDSRRGGTHGARLLRHRTGSGVCRRNRDALAIPEQQEGHARRRRTDVLGDQPGTEGGSLNSLLLVSNCITQSTFVWGGTGRRRPSSTRMEPPFGYRRSENRLWPAGAAWVR